METVKVNTSQHIDIDYPVAGLGERVAARLIDFGLFIAIFIIFLLLFQMIGLSSGGSIFSFIPFIIYAVGFVFYDLLCEIFMNGQSVGKRLLKIKVISLDGAQASLGQYFIRWVFRIVDFTLTQWLGALICVAVTDNKQRIGDIVAGTTLIKTVPRTQFQHIAFHPVAEEYNPVFDSVHQMTDRDIELIHEVLNTYYKTRNHDLIYHMAARVSNHLGIVMPNGMNELEFLKTVIMDYNQLTSRAV
ncbi:RDD family protein [Pedobacter sp. LMG 31464]|uniref:RDD family protein n=1 Tax=Pedobacter planticolens TaxID=2679964 RepID=A0A923IW00_9SPHI|nr:RDD family protein [Pedobacter planticolens]MBB2146581.1 RDD family protein [Pedobacter planticolens]